MRKMFKMLLAAGFTIMVFTLFPMDQAHADNTVKDHNKLFEVQTESINMRTAPNEDSDIVGELLDGNRLRTFEEKDGWVKTFYDGKPVWVYSEELLLIEENNVLENDKEDNKTVESADEVETIPEQEQEEEEVHHSNEKDDIYNENFTHEHVSNEEVNLPAGVYQPKEVKISEDTIVVLKNQLNGYEIMIDAGHGGRDGGAVNDGVQEKNFTLATAAKVAKQLEEEGATVLLTRKDDTFISLQDRVYQSNNQNTDAFISLHYDYFSDSDANGVNTYYYNQASSAELAENIHKALMDEVDMTDRGIRREAYYVLQNNQKPAVLLELGFMTNPGDLEKIQSEEYQDKVAKAITNGLVEYFGEDSVQ